MTQRNTQAGTVLVGGMSANVTRQIMDADATFTGVAEMTADSTVQGGAQAWSGEATLAGASDLAVMLSKQTTIAVSWGGADV